MQTFCEEIAQIKISAFCKLPFAGFVSDCFLHKMTVKMYAHICEEIAQIKIYAICKSPFAGFMPSFSLHKMTVQIFTQLLHFTQLFQKSIKKIKKCRAKHIFNSGFPKRCLGFFVNFVLLKFSCSTDI